MNIATIGLSIALVGIPLLIGAFFLVRYFGQSKASVGVSGLIAGIASAGVIYFFMGESRLTRDGDYVLVMPWMVGASLIVGAFTGFIARKRSSESG